MYVAEKIGEDYKDWKPGEIIVINAQTGSGKTYFILNTLLPYVASKGERLLYLSNRSALRDQVSQEFAEEFQDSICIMTYQKFERLRLYNNVENELAEQVLSCKYLVMDEAHYFLSDAAFNGNIKSSLGKIRRQKESAVLIYITATREYLLLSLSASKILNQSPPTFEFCSRIIDLCNGCPKNIGSSICGYIEKGLNRTFMCQRCRRKNTYVCEGYFSDAPIIQRFSKPEMVLKYKELADSDYRGCRDEEVIEQNPC